VTPGLTVAAALAAGILCQGIAHHLRTPGIVLLLAAGALLGPDGAGVVRPELLGDTLQTLVGFAVAVILFEGGMNLQLSRLRRQSRSIRHLITVGVLITAAGAAGATRAILGWDWPQAILLGTLVIVTGPTVVGPLVRRIKLHPRLQTVLEGEGVLIDPIGAIIAVAALEAVLHPAGSLLPGVIGVGARLGVGMALGLAGGFAIAFLLRPRWLVPPGLQNVTVLALVLALFQGSEALFPDSGIAAVTMAGLVVGNIRTAGLDDLMEFKEQLTVLFIGMLFVLLSADVRFAEIRALGVPGLVLVGALMVVVRPVGVLLSTVGSGLTWREKTFLSWMAPRGIVAAAVASFFAVSLHAAGLPGGAELRALTFLVIAVTVLVYGLTGGVVARALGLQRPRNQGYVILGASELGRALGTCLAEAGENVLLLDSNGDAITRCEEAGLRAMFGNALEERTLLRAQIDTMTGVVGLTPNEEVNLLFLTKVHRDFTGPALYIALHSNKGHVTPVMIDGLGARRLFGGERDVDLWSVRLERGLAVRERWRWVGEEGRGKQGGDGEKEGQPNAPGELASRLATPRALAADNGAGRSVLPLIAIADGKAAPLDERWKAGSGTVVDLLVFTEAGDRAREWLRVSGWAPVALVEAGSSA